MRLTLDIDPDLIAMMQAEIKAGEKAVTSSITFRMRKRLPSANWSRTKSTDQRALAKASVSRSVIEQIDLCLLQHVECIFSKVQQFVGFSEMPNRIIVRCGLVRQRRAVRRNQISEEHKRNGVQELFGNIALGAKPSGRKYSPILPTARLCMLVQFLVFGADVNARFDA